MFITSGISEPTDPDLRQLIFRNMAISTYHVPRIQVLNIDLIRTDYLENNYNINISFHIQHYHTVVRVIIVSYGTVVDQLVSVWCSRKVKRYLIRQWISANCIVILLTDNVALSWLLLLKSGWFLKACHCIFCDNTITFEHHQHDFTAGHAIWILSNIKSL